MGSLLSVRRIRGLYGYGCCRNGLHCRRCYLRGLGRVSCGIGGGGGMGPRYCCGEGGVGYGWRCKDCGYGGRGDGCGIERVLLVTLSLGGEEEGEG